MEVAVVAVSVSFMCFVGAAVFAFRCVSEIYRRELSKNSKNKVN